jgi:hypothetical protein
VPVVSALADELSTGEPMLDREAFRAVVGRVRQRTGLKGRPLLHPIRLALTGEPEGIELDVAVPALERGARIESHGLRAIPGAAARATLFSNALRRRG